jgi:hypothetical protein
MERMMPVVERMMMAEMMKGMMGMMMTMVAREMTVKLALDYILITGKNKNGCGY